MNLDVDDRIPKYSAATLKVQRQAFKQLFSVPDDILKQNAVIKWMASAPIWIVEYDGILPGEDKLISDRRQEMKEVYDADIEGLVKHLRNIYPDRGELQSWALIFSVANEISSADDIIEQAVSKVAFSEDDSLKTDESNNESTTKVVEVPIIDERKTTTKNIATGNVRKIDSAESYIATNNVNSSKEEEKMVNTNIIDAAKGMAAQAEIGGADPRTQVETAEQQPVTVGKTDKFDVDDKDRKFVADSLQADKDARDTASRNGRVKKIITTSYPAALRLVDPSVTKGKLHELSMKNAQKKLEEKINKFTQACSGNSAMTIASFSAKPTFVNVSTDQVKYKEKSFGFTYVDVAKEMWNIFSAVLNDNNLEYDALVPDEADVSYPVKGVETTDGVFSEHEFVEHLLNDTLGWMYADGSLDNAGKPIEKACEFKVKFAKKKDSKGKKTQEEGKMTAKNEEQLLPVLKVVVANKKTFTTTKEVVEELFPDRLEELADSPFTALIPITVTTKDENGKDVTETIQIPAAIKVKQWLKDKDKFKKKKITNNAGKTVEIDDTTKPIMVSFAMKVSLKTYKPDTRKCKSDYMVGEDVLATKMRWNIKFGQVSDTELDYASQAAISAITYIYKKPDLLKQLDLKIDQGTALDNLFNLQIANQNAVAANEASAIGDDDDDNTTPEAQ